MRLSGAMSCPCKKLNVRTIINIVNACFRVYPRLTFNVSIIVINEARHALIILKES